MTRHRVAVVGLGFGQAHLASYLALADRFEVVAICDTEQRNLDNAARWFAGPDQTTSFDDVLERDDVDIVDVCTPPLLHAPMTRRALETGRHAICEKPLAPSLREVDELIDLESRSPGTVMPIFQYRYGNGAARMRHLLDRDLMGTPFVASVETFWTRDAAYYSSPWRGRLDTELGGVCAMHAIHAYDLLVSVLGPIESVFAQTAVRVNPIETEDCAAVVLRFRSGALATLIATLGSAREISRMRIHWQHVSVESGASAYGGSAEPWTIEPVSPEAAARIDDALGDFVVGRDLLDRQLELFADALDTGGPSPLTIGDARAAIELLTAIYSSAQQGAPVDLPIGDDHPHYGSWALGPAS
ncbi:MAG: Gfo/Idh/MocA family oxidoreductase [Actinomycetota bacterium]